MSEMYILPVESIFFLLLLIFFMFDLFQGLGAIMGIIMDGMALTVAAVPDTSGCTQFGIYCV